MPYAFLTNMAETAPTRWDPWLPVEMLGWSWSANFNHLRARAVGASGLIVLAVVVISVWQRRARLAQFVPALAFVGYSIGLMTLVGAFRGQLAAWYSSTVGFFWVGVLGVLIQIAPELSPRTTWRWGFPVFASFVLLWMTNGDFSEKARYLLSRGFTASSCLRNFRTAPAVCEGTLFQWKRGNPQNLWVLGEPLEKRGWGVFGPEQTWSLQGDFAFDNVEFRGAEPSWVTPEGVVASPLTSFQKLNLELSRSSRIDWQLALPGGLREARLRTVVSNAGRLRVWLSSVSGRELLLARTSLAGTTTEVDVSFVRWAGQVVTLSLELDANEAATLVAQFPRIEVSLNADARSPQVSYAVPIVGERGRDLVFDASLQSWQLTALKPLGGGRFGAMGWAPTMTLKERLNVCAADYSRLVVRGSPSPDMRFRELHVMTRDPEGPEPTKNSMYLSMFSGSSRDYAFRLRLLGLPPDAVLPTLALRPPPGDYFEVSEVRLERRDGQTRCRARR